MEGNLRSKIIEYLGIWPEFIEDELNQEAIREAELVEAKYEDALSDGSFAYSFHGDVCRFFDNEKETVYVVERLKHITVFEVKSKDKMIEHEAALVDRLSDAVERSEETCGSTTGKENYVKE